MIGLIDGNNFFVSCERIFDLSLAGKPVAVLSNNDGCVISRSYEFKALNIPMGTPYFQIKPLIARHGLILKSSNYELYGDISRRIITTLQEFSPDVEQYSIDEAFIQLNLEKNNNYFDYGKIIRNTILQWVGVPCGVGIAATKTLAKIANHIGKKSPDGVFVMPDDASGVLAAIPVGDVWGIGRRLTPKLETAGIRNAGQLAAADEVWLQQKFNIGVARTAMELRGQTVFSEDNPEELSQSISCSRSFGRPVVELTELSEAVAHYTAQAAVKLRGEGQTAAGVNVYFQYYPEYAPRALAGGFTSTTVTFPSPTASTTAMLTAIIPQLKGIFIAGRRYKKAGIIFFGLESGAARQLDLFTDTAKNEKAERLSAAVDKINRKFGAGAIFNLAEGIERPWAMRRDLLTPSYTTNWDQLLRVK